MDNSDAFGSSTAPLTWHDFLERMRHPSATDFVKAIKSFIVSFLNNAPDAERDSIAVQEFLSNMESAFRAHTLWAGSSEEDLESAGEGLEKYVMTKLFTRVFASVPEDVKADEQLSEKMALVQQFIRPENLDIKPTFQNEASWLLAQKELQKMNMYKAPRDKLVCILHCCKVISNLLLNASLASNGDHPGADEFLPVLIYVTIKANPPQLHSNLSYIQRFRRQNRLVGEAAYFFTNMLSVESFVSNIDAKALSMDELDFEKNMESAQLLLSGLSESSDQNSTHLSTAEPVEIKSSLATRKPPQTAAHHQSLPEPEFRSDELYSKDPYSLTKSPSIPDLENKGAAMLLKEDEAGRIFREFPYLYTQASDLVVGDVEDLLNSYKQLVFKYVCLAKGMGVTTSATPFPPPSNTQKGTTEQPEVAKTEQPKVAKDSETGREVDPSDDLQKELAEVVDNSGFGSESVEKKVPEEAIVEAQSEENSQR